ncbi:uncharacterized protein LOC108667715 [Hyalella azteca]|uniref:Uncharacterized protein LOC108667715 n=1 Tax=Hyalella azteca TaxID=294128 RepID=A0A8B7N8L9_HYAAZ|nr:uncharacterized protein LOC108667715 [Hyalella azteca]
MRRIADLTAVLFFLVISFTSAGDASGFQLLRGLKISRTYSNNSHLLSSKRMEVSGPSIRDVNFGSSNKQDFEKLTISDIMKAAVRDAVREKAYRDSAPKISGPSELYSVNSKKLEREGQHNCTSRSSSHTQHELMSGKNLTLATAVFNASQTLKTNWSIVRDVTYPNGSRFGSATSPNQTPISAHTRPHEALSHPRSQFGHDRPRRSRDSCDEPGCLPPGSVVKCKKDDEERIIENRPVFFNLYRNRVAFKIRATLWLANKNMDEKAYKTAANLNDGSTIKTASDWKRFKIEATTDFPSKNWTIIFTIESDNFSRPVVTNYTIDDYRFGQLVISVPVRDVLWFVGAAPNCSAFSTLKPLKERLSTTTDQTSPTLRVYAKQPASPGASRPQLLWLLLLFVPLVARIAVMKRKGQESALDTSMGVQNENISPIYDDICGPIHLTQKVRQMPINSLCGQVAPDQIKSRSTINTFLGHDARRFENHQQSSRQNLAGNITAPNEYINSGRSGPVDEAHYELYIQANELVNSNIYDNDGEM